MKLNEEYKIRKELQKDYPFIDEGWSGLLKAFWYSFTLPELSWLQFILIILILNYIF